MLQDLTPLTLGVRLQHDQVGKLIKRNTSIPCEHEETYYTVKDNQTMVKIRVVQGESETASLNH